MLNAFFLFLAVLNCVVIFLFERDRSPKIERIFETVTSNHVIVVTNYISQSSGTLGASNVSSNVLEDLVRPRYAVNYRYRYFVFNGRRFAAIDGNENLSAGSPTSYGRIREIFPDRIILDNGIWLVNPGFSRSVFSDHESLAALPGKSEMPERIRQDGTSIDFAGVRR